MNRLTAISIAGFDPSAGAGVLADIKTFEQHKIMGFGVNTANTAQTEDQFFEVNWVDPEVVNQQVTALIDRYEIQGVKIGLVPDVEWLAKTVQFIHLIQSQAHYERPIIIWDPVLSASAGFEFNQNVEALPEVLRLIDWITPNWEEVEQLTGKSGEEGAIELSKKVKVYLKGGHRTDSPGTDVLFFEGKRFQIHAKKNGSEKHGTGCVLSSAFLSSLMKGYPTLKAAQRAKRYIEQLRTSNSSLLGYHKV